MRIDPVKLGARVKHWRNLLSLDKLWEIEIKIVPNALMMPADMRDAVGACDTDSSYFQACLYFCEEHCSDEHELELTVIHELLHIVMNPLEIAARANLPGTHEKITDMLLESTIERLSRAYVAANKGRS